jgi:hypothetical protein
MTALDVVFRYNGNLGGAEMRSLNHVREVYGIRRIAVNEQEKTIRIEYDASHLNEASVAALLRHAGVDLREPLTRV